MDLVAHLATLIFVLTNSFGVTLANRMATLRRA
jgi:hypothetical protein